MRDRVRSSWRVAIVAAFVLLGAIVPARTEPSDEVPTVATVKAVDLENRLLWVITGTGHALRLVEFHVPPECRIERSGTSARLADLEPGQVVEVRHRKERHRQSDAYEAVSIEARNG
jgi:hypothetical protein